MVFISIFDANCENISHELDAKLHPLLTKKIIEIFIGDFSKHNPCTMVFRLVDELNNPGKVLDE